MKAKKMLHTKHCRHSSVILTKKFVCDYTEARKGNKLPLKRKRKKKRGLIRHSFPLFSHADSMSNAFHLPLVRLEPTT